MASSAEAAALASRQNRGQRGAIHHAALRRQASTNRRLVKERAWEKIDDMTVDGTWLPESRINAFLEDVLMREKGSLHPDGVQLVVDTARRTQEKAGLTPPANMEGAIAKEAMLNSVEKYGEFIKNAKKIHEVFRKYDRHQTGYLTRKQLMRMLQDYEMKSDRAKMAMAMKFVVTDEDIDWILGECDADHNGQISHAEYLPAVAAWEQLAQMKLEESSKCIIL